MMSCCICSKKISGYGHNAEPLSQGECCDTCNVKVISARLKHSESAELEDLKQRLQRLENQFQNFIELKQTQDIHRRRKLLKLADSRRKLLKLADSLHEIDLRGRN